MTPKQQAFIEEYLKCWNASEAARRVGYNGRANTIGPRLLSNVVIQAAIQERLHDMTMQADEVLVRLSEQARGLHGQYINEQGEVDIKKIVEDKKQYLIKGIKETKWGKEIEFFDTQAALVHIGRHYGLFTDNIDIHDWRTELERAGFNAGDEFEKLVQYFADRLATDDTRGSEGSETEDTAT